MNRFKTGIAVAWELFIVAFFGIWDRETFNQICDNPIFAAAALLGLAMILLSVPAIVILIVLFIHGSAIKLAGAAFVGGIWLAFQVFRYLFFLGSVAQ